MTKKRQSFSTEFKLEAVNLILDKGYSYPEACRALGVGEMALPRWTKQRRQELEGIMPKGKAVTSEQQQIQAIEKRIQRLELEKDILKRLPLS